MRRTSGAAAKNRDRRYETLEARDASHAAARCDASNIENAVLAIQRFGRDLRDSRRDLLAACREPSIARRNEWREACDASHTNRCDVAPRNETDIDPRP